MQLYLDELEKLLNSLDETNKQERLTILNSYIEILAVHDPNNPILYDKTKELIAIYIDLVDSRVDYGYDFMSVTKLNTFVIRLNRKFRDELYLFSIRTLRSLHYEEEVKSLERFRSKNLLWYTIKRHGYFSRLHLVLFYAVNYNLITLLLSCLAMPILAILILYPSDLDVPKLFVVEYHHHYCNGFLSHIANCILFFIGLNGISIEPKNFLGVLLLLLSKLFFVLIVLNVLLDKINKHYLK